MVLVPLATTLRLADILSSSLSALHGHSNPLDLGPVKRAAVLVVDGLGAHNLRGVSGHARWLSSRWASRGLSADAGFPSTTASALTTLTTGVEPGQHGIAGYTLRDPDSGVLINHLKSWRPHVDPDTWQRVPTLFERAHNDGIASLALGEPRFQGSDFTLATWRGAQFQGVNSLPAQGVALREFFDSHDSALAYLYWPALDRTGHSSGCGSLSWTHRLEELDQWVREIESLLHEDEGLIITADHGMVDIASEGKIFIDEGSPLLENVVAWGGEPRAVQLYATTPDAREDLASAWRETLGDAAWVMTRDEVIEGGLLGLVDPQVAQRLGDVVVACQGHSVVYRRAQAGATSMAMVGQHGSVSEIEREIPVIPLGAWA